MRSRILTVVMVVAVAIALTSTLLTSYDSRNKADCQASINTKFLEVQKIRAKINDRDREAVGTLLDKLLAASQLTDRKSILKAQNDARETYRSTQKTLTDLRDSNPLPAKISCDYDNPIQFGSAGS